DELVTMLESSGRSVLFDDRPKLSPGVKFADAEVLGMPHIVIVGRGASDGIVEYWNRRSGERTEMPLAQVLGMLPALD
ncbi:MAG: prolyl-tRNA synthetase, partial [Pontimonas sp.]